MRKFLTVAAVAALGYMVGRHWNRPPPAPAEAANPQELASNLEVEKPAAAEPQKYHCDGRVYCSQMTTCEEATYFLRNCPGVKMDGEGDGVPCERQWCGDH